MFYRSRERNSQMSWVWEPIGLCHIVASNWKPAERDGAPAQSPAKLSVRCNNVLQSSIFVTYRRTAAWNRSPRKLKQLFTATHIDSNSFQNTNCSHSGWILHVNTLNRCDTAGNRPISHSFFIMDSHFSEWKEWALQLVLEETKWNPYSPNEFQAHASGLHGGIVLC